MGEAITLGRFVCGERVATGPVGALHRARVFGDAGFEKDFALLVVDGELARDKNALGRLVRAANAWARLNHPRIAHAHELSVEGETYYLVSDWLRAATLSAIAVEGPLPLDAALVLIADVAEALAYAHGRADLLPGGILHLGLSPETIVVDGNGHATVRDFGLLTARVSDDWTTQDRFAYSLRYCAPELLQGGIVDGRADVFALAAVLFEIVAGHAAFGGTRARDVTAQIELSPPSLTGVPPAAGPLLARALEARAAARMPSMAELRAQALALVGDRVGAARAKLAERARARLPADQQPRVSPIDVPTTPAPTGVRAVSLADDFFNASIDVVEPPPLPPPPSMLPSAGAAKPLWGGRPLLQPATPTLWDPPSTTATTTLDALRRKRGRPWLRAVALLALSLAVAGGAYVWQRYDRAHARLAAERAQSERKAAAIGMTTRVTSTPAGAPLFVDGTARGTTPATLTLPPGEHRVVVAVDGRQLFRQAIAAGTTVEAMLLAPKLAALDGDAGLKLVCKIPGAWRVFVDGVDTGRGCPVEERLPIAPGAHKLSLYSPEGDKTIERPIVVKDRGSSTRIIIEEE